MIELGPKGGRPLGDHGAVVAGQFEGRKEHLKGEIPVGQVDPIREDSVPAVSPTDVHIEAVDEGAQKEAKEGLVDGQREKAHRETAGAAKIAHLTDFHLLTDSAVVGQRACGSR